MLASESVARVIHEPAVMYGRVVVLALIAVALVIALHYVLAALGGGKRTPRPGWSFLSRVVYAAVVLAVVLLAATAFYGMLAHGVLEGWLLMLHMMGSGMLTFLLPVLAVLWGKSCTFGPNGEPGAAAMFSPLAKALYWVILASGVIAALTMFVSMLPIFGTDGLRTLLDIHRYTGLLVAVATALHLYLVWAGRAGRA